MGQLMPARQTVNQSKDTTPKLKNVIPELQNVVLEAVEPLNEPELGRGAYGTVFTVRYGGTVCAAKKIHPILIDSGNDEVKQKMKGDFIQECLCCSRIRHPNIVYFIGVYYEPAQSFLPIMVMELMHTSLTKFVDDKKSKISFGEKISVLHDVSVGLNFLHSHQPQIIHRDLSSNNVLLTKELVAKIGDLGVAKVIPAGSMDKLKLTRAIPGTPDFMPPEVMEVNSVYGTPVDVFSFGGIILHLFSEEWPTPGAHTKKDSDTKMMINLNEIQRRKQYLDKMIGEAAELRILVEGCLEDDPDKRPAIQKVSTFIESLKV